MTARLKLYCRKIYKTGRQTYFEIFTSTVQFGSYSGRQTGSKTGRQPGKNAEIHQQTCSTEIQMDRQKNNQTGSKAGRQTERQTHRQTPDVLSLDPFLFFPVSTFCP